MSLKIFFLFILTAAISSTSFAQERYVKPADEAKKDPSFFAFREKLIAAAKKKDSKYLLSIVDPDIKNGFGGDDGIKEFTSRWDFGGPDNDDFWDEFLPVITNGGSFLKTNGNSIFFAPYVFNAFPEDLDVFKYRVITGKNVNLRKDGI